MKEASEWRRGFISGLSVGLSAAAVALSLCNFLVKHGAVGDDCVGRAAAVEASRGGEGRGSAGHDGADVLAPGGLAEGVLEGSAAKPDLDDGEGDGSDVGDEDGASAEGGSAAEDNPLWMFPVYLMLNSPHSSIGTTLCCFSSAVRCARVKERDRERGDGNDKCKNLHAGDYSK